MVKKYTNAEVLDFLRKNPVMNLSFIGDRKPHATVLLFHVTDDFTFYFGAKEISYKGRALIQNPGVSLSVWQHKQMLVQADGFVSRVIDENVDDVLTKITSSIPMIKDFWPPILRTKGDDYVAFEIKLTWLRVLDLTNPSINEEESPFTEFKLVDK